MEFGNPIVGGQDLIREAIKSPDFTTDPENGNVTGWRIARDGTATFYNLVIGSENYNVDENGNAVFQELTATDITLAGENLSVIMDRLPRGMVANVSAPTSSAVYAGTEIPFNGLVIPNFDGTRQYNVGVIGRVDMAGTTADYVGIRARYAWDAEPTTASSTLFESQDGGLSGTSDWSFNAGYPFSMPNPSGTDLHIRFGLFVDGNGGKYLGTSWGRAWATDIGQAVQSSVWTPTVPPKQQYTKTYAATGSASFMYDGTNRVGYDSGYCFQGYFSSANGNQFSLITFPVSVQLDLTGATINKVELYLKNRHFYSASGGTAYVGYSPYSSVSGNVDYGNVSQRISNSHFDYGQGKWITVSNSIGDAFKSGAAKSIALGKGPTSDQIYYGYFAGNGQSGEPQLRITYTR